MDWVTPAGAGPAKPKVREAGGAMHGSNILLFAALLLLLVQSTVVESAVGDNTRGGKPDKDTSNDIVQQAIEDGECDEYDLLCIEARSLNPIAVSVEDILSSSWESKKRALVSSSRIKVVGRHKGNNGQVKVRRLLTKDGRSWTSPTLQACQPSVFRTHSNTYPRFQV